jgi:NDP-sugar pyrophosphorylase family protein
MLEYVIEAAITVVPPQDVYIIIGHEAESVRAAVESLGVKFVLQAEQHGTGHAIMCAREQVASYQNILVLSGDVPLIRPETVARLRDFHLSKKAAMTILTAAPSDPFGYGRVIRASASDRVKAIVEQKALTKAQQGLREINSGIYAFTTKPLFTHIDRLNPDTVRREMFLTDMAALLVKAKATVVAIRASDPSEVLGANTLAELASIDATLRGHKCSQLMAAGVIIYRPETCIIDQDVTVGADTIIEPFVQLRGKARIGAHCFIPAYSVIIDTELPEGTTFSAESRISSVSAESRISSVPKLASFLRNKLQNIKPGNSDATTYHDNVYKALVAIFSPYLRPIGKEVEIHEGRKRIDIIFSNVALSGFFAHLALHGTPSRFVFIECKNYGGELGNPELDQIAGRFSKNRGQFGIMFCRQIADRGKMLRRCRDTLNDNRGYVLVMDDSDLIKLCDFYDAGKQDTLFDFLDERLFELCS